MKFSDSKIFFDCPFHGLEDQVFCFRASDKELNGRWVKYNVTYEKDEISEEEIKGIQKELSK